MTEASRTAFILLAFLAAACGSTKRNESPAAAANDAGTTNDSGTLPEAGQSDTGSPLDGGSACLEPHGNAPGSLDTGFGTAGIAPLGTAADGGANSLLSAMVRAPDGKILGLTASDCFVYRVGTDGSADASFGSAGTQQLDISGYCLALALDATGRILVGGMDDSAPFMTRLSSEGTVDTSFGDQGYARPDFGATNSRIIDLELRADGSIVALGLSDANGASPGTRLVFLDSEGVVVTAGGADAIELSTGAGRNFGVGVAEQEDGSLLVVGQNQTDSLAFLARVDADGALVTSFGDAGWVRTAPASISSVVGFSRNLDGESIAWGDTGQALVTLDSDGTLSTFSEQSGLFPRSVTTQCDGKVLVTGIQTLAGNNAALARFLPDGTVDATFGENGIHGWDPSLEASELISAAIDGETGILVGGNSASSPFIARIWL